MDLKTGVWASVDMNCAISYMVDATGIVELHFGGTDGFDFDLHPRAARRLGEVMEQALAEQALIQDR